MLRLHIFDILSLQKFDILSLWHTNLIPCSVLLTRFQKCEGGRKKENKTLKETNLPS